MEKPQVHFVDGAIKLMVGVEQVVWVARRAVCVGEKKGDSSWEATLADVMWRWA